MTKKNKNKGGVGQQSTAATPSQPVAENGVAKAQETVKEVSEAQIPKPAPVPEAAKVAAKEEKPVQNGNASPDNSTNTNTKKKNKNTNNAAAAPGAGAEKAAKPTESPSKSTDSSSTVTPDKSAASSESREGSATLKKNNKKKKSKKNVDASGEPKEKVKVVVDPVLAEELKQKRIEARKLKKKLKKLNLHNQNADKKLEATGNGVQSAPAAAPAAVTPAPVPAPAPAPVVSEKKVEAPKVEEKKAESPSQNNKKQGNKADAGKQKKDSPKPNAAEKVTEAPKAAPASAAAPVAKNDKKEEKAKPKEEAKPVVAEKPAPAPAPAKPAANDTKKNEAKPQAEKKVAPEPAKKEEKQQAKKPEPEAPKKVEPQPAKKPEPEAPKKVEPAPAKAPVVAEPPKKVEPAPVAEPPKKVEPQPAKAPVAEAPKKVEPQPAKKPEPEAPKKVEPAPAKAPVAEPPKKAEPEPPKKAEVEQPKEVAKPKEEVKPEKKQPEPKKEAEKQQPNKEAKSSPPPKQKGNDKKSASKTPEPKPKLEKQVSKPKEEKAAAKVEEVKESQAPATPPTQTLNEILKQAIKNDEQAEAAARNKSVEIEIAVPESQTAAAEVKAESAAPKTPEPVAKNVTPAAAAVVPPAKAEDAVKPGEQKDLAIKTMIESIEKAVNKTVEVLKSNIDESKQQKDDPVMDGDFSPLFSSSPPAAEAKPTVPAAAPKPIEDKPAEITKVEPAPQKGKDKQTQDNKNGKKPDNAKPSKNDKKQNNKKDDKKASGPKNAEGSDFVPSVNTETRGVKSLNENNAEPIKTETVCEKDNKEAANLKEQIQSSTENKANELPEINPQAKIEPIKFESDVLIDILDAKMSAPLAEAPAAPQEANKPNAAAAGAKSKPAPDAKKKEKTPTKNVKSGSEPKTSTATAPAPAAATGAVPKQQSPPAKAATPTPAPAKPAAKSATPEKTAPTAAPARTVSPVKKLSPPRAVTTTTTATTTTKPEVPPKPDNLKKLAQESKKSPLKTTPPPAKSPAAALSKNAAKPEVPHKPDYLKQPQKGSSPRTGAANKVSSPAGSAGSSSTSDSRSRKTELNDVIKAFIMKNMDIPFPDSQSPSSSSPQSSQPKQYSSDTQLKLLEALVEKNLELKAKSEGAARKKDKSGEASSSSSAAAATASAPPAAPGSRALLTKEQIKILLPFAEALQAELKKPKIKTGGSADQSIPESNFLKLSAVQDSMSNKNIFINEEDDDDDEDDDDNGEEGEEYMEYRFAPRQVFISTICQVCKTQLKQFITCKQCGMVSYCSAEHQQSDESTHKSLCVVIQELAKKRGGHIYNMAKKLTDQEYRNIRVHTLHLCENMLKRSLQPFEREIILFPRICYATTCREWHQDLLIECKDCKQVSYCKSNPEHLQESHAKWCKAFLLYQQLVLRQKILGRIEPVLPARILQKQFEMPNSVNEVYRNMYKNITAIKDQCNYATLTQISTAPLTALKSYQQYTAHRKIDISAKIETFTIHLIGAELQFEGDTLDKWESFFLHLVPQIMELRVVFIGPELNVENLPIDIISRIRMCRTCRQTCRAVKFDFQCKKFYHDYCDSANFSKPDLICFYNPGLHRTTGFSGFDTWPKTIKAAAVQKAPIVVTAYTELEAPLDLDRIKREAGRELTVVQEPIVNPFASQRPERNFISDEIAPMIYKNYYYFVVY